MDVIVYRYFYFYLCENEIDQNVYELTKWGRIDREKFYEKWVPVDQNESKLTCTKWLENELTLHRINTQDVNDFQTANASVGDKFTYQLFAVCNLLYRIGINVKLKRDKQMNYDTN